MKLLVVTAVQAFEKEALKKIEFLVVHEQFMTATAQFADILLPVNTQLERNDIIRPWHSGNYYIHLPPGLHEVLMDVRLGIRAARIHVAAGRMKVRERPVDEVKIDILLNSLEEFNKGITSDNPLKAIVLPIERYV